MVLGFKKHFDKAKEKPTNFKVKIFNGTKIHSFRLDPNKRWKPGRIIHMAYGVRSKSKGAYDNFLTRPCDGIQEFAFDFNNEGRMYIHFLYDGGEPAFGHIMNREQEEQVAINDGFKSYSEMQDYFKDYPRITLPNGTCLNYFIIRCIHWTSFRYKAIPF